MNEDSGREWRKRQNWAQCREPYKTELDTLGSHWIEGNLSNEGLALEAIKLLSELEWVKQPDDATSKLALEDVINQIKLLTEAMLACSAHPDQTPELRLQSLTFMRREMNKGEDLAR